jgi:hypothetical protein
MYRDRKIICDTFSDVHDLLEPWVDVAYWQFDDVHRSLGDIYIIGRKQFVENTAAVKAMARSGQHTIVFANTGEGASTQMVHLDMLGITDLVLDGRILLLTGGAVASRFPHLVHEHFLIRILAYEENLQQMSRADEIYAKTQKPYKFLFLNGRARPHRKYLLERFRLSGLLDQSLWTMLEGRPCGNRILSLPHQGQDLMTTASSIRHLPCDYEVPRYQKNTALSADRHDLVKFDLFDNTWGEIYLHADAYIDTYFSLVTETVFDGVHSFRTEKIAKPLAQAHPWICAANAGFYRGMRDLGFQTFHTLIDESFDLIQDTQQRMDRIAMIVEDLCRQDLVAFLKASEGICKYNQQPLQTLVTQERHDFPTKFFAFLDTHAR